MTFSAWLKRDVERRMAIPADFAHALDALRLLETAAIHQREFEDWRKQSDAVDLLRRFVFDRATPTEMHERAEQRFRR